MKNLIQRIWLALAVGLCLSLATAGTSAASSAATEAAQPVLVKATDDLSGLPTAAEDSAPLSTAAACPTPGQRIKTASNPRVYLVGPGSVLYYIPNETVYFDLWDSWNGISIVGSSVFADCGWSTAYELSGGFLAKTTSSPRVYIWDAWYGFRWIPSEAVFNKYAFSWSQIESYSAISPISSLNWWE
ncbi:hypothetical protein [Streptomyces sp. T028]|uniref:hypothetical protein n=1 Tax=Streptomyces sp. T028 TaxID=3394379 RepID=UPI003A851DE9